MINIKKIGYALCHKLLLSLGFLIVLGFPIYLVALWVTTDFNPYFLQIDSCLDRGGIWLDEVNQCDEYRPNGLDEKY